MAVSAFQKLVNKLFQQFIKLNGREPQTPKEWMDIQNEAVQFFNKTKGVPPGPAKPPFQGWKPKVIPGGKGIESLLKSGDVKVGVAPKTTKETLKTKKDRGILLRDSEEGIARIKRENKQAIEDFKQKEYERRVKAQKDKAAADEDYIPDIIDPEEFAGGGLAYMLGEPTYMKMANGGDVEIPQEFLEDLQKREFHELLDKYRRFQEDYHRRRDLAPTQEVASGGKVGHGPWTTGQTPPGPQTQPEMPQPQVQGQPNPMKAPRLPSVAPRNMDPQVMQQQRMQQAMMQQGIPQGIPRVGMMYGGDPGFAFEYGGSWADWHDQHRNAMPIEDYIQTKLPKERLPFRENYAGGGMTRRAFMKLIASLGALPFIGKGVQKAAPKAIKEVTETITRNSDGIPDYAFDLIEVVKAKGTKEIIEGIAKRNPPATKYNYKGVEVTEDGLGNTSVRKEMEETRSWNFEEDVLIDDVVDREVGFEIRKGGTGVKDEGLETQKSFEMPDEYDESTAYMQGDPEGGMDVSDITEVIEEADHLELKKIADEATTEFDKFSKIRKKKASGGLAHLLGE
jgi:hypothetical protein